MAKTLDYICKNVEITNSCEDYEWEDATELAREIIEAQDDKCRLIWITAGNVDWQGRSGYVVKEIPVPEDFWSTVAGWDRADWTIRVVEAKGNKVMATAYSHDTPTGGGRVVTFMDGKLIYERLLASGWTYQELVKELKWTNSANDITHWSKEVIYDILEQDLSDGELMEMF